MRLLFGKTRQTKARHLGETSTLTTSDYYAGMNEDYRWFRKDELVRKCISTNAYYATLTAGFDTILEPTSEGVAPEDYTYIKDKIDEYNRRVNLDQALFVAQVKRSIYGRCRVRDRTQRGQVTRVAAQPTEHPPQATAQRELGARSLPVRGKNLLLRPRRGPLLHKPQPWA